MFIRKYLVVLVIFFSLTVSAIAEHQVNWAGPLGGGAWNIAANWEAQDPCFPPVVPVASDTPVFYKGLDRYAIVDVSTGNVVVDNLYIAHRAGDGRVDINSGVQLTTSGACVVGATGGLNDTSFPPAEGWHGELNINGGTLNTGAPLYIGGLSLYPNNASGYMTVNGGQVNANSIYVGRDLFEGSLTIIDGNVEVMGDAYFADGTGLAGYGYPQIASLDLQGGSLTVHGGLLFGVTASKNGIATMSGGTLNTDFKSAECFFIGLNGYGEFTITGGTINSSAIFVAQGMGTGRFNIYGGTVNISVFLGIEDSGYGDGFVDITKGTLIIDGDQRSFINEYLGNGLLGAYGGDPRATVNVDYGKTNWGKTTVTATGFDPNIAWNPFPADGTGDVLGSVVTLTWNAGDNTKATGGHMVYVSTNFDEVNDGTVPDSIQDANSYIMSGLTEGQIYYWRVDEVDTSDVVHKGQVWSFAAYYRVIDDFESYNSGDLITNSWIAGSGTTVAVDTGMVVEGSQSMKLTYNNSASPYYSEAVYDLGSNQDWTNVKSLALNFIGSSGNAAEQLYVTIEDSVGSKVTIVYDGDSSDVVLAEAWQTTWWNNWDINVTDLTGLNRQSVRKISIGLGNKANPAAGGSGTMYFDYFRKYFITRCITDKAVGDVTGDCLVNLSDFAVMAANWFAGPSEITGIAPVSGPVLWYQFEETSGTNVSDSSGHGFSGTASSSTIWDAAGKIGRCANFDGIAGVASNPAVFGNIAGEMTVCTWLKGATLTPASAGIVFVAYSPYLENVFATVPNSNGAVYFTANGDDIVWQHDSNQRPNSSDWYGQWHHYAFVKNAAAGTLKIYQDGVLVAEESGNTASLVNGYVPSSSLLEVGGYFIGGGSDFYKGKMDDFRIYNYALSQANIVYLVQGSSSLMQPLLNNTAEISGDGLVNFKDMEIMVSKWLDTLMWP